MAEADPTQNPQTPPPAESCNAARRPAAARPGALRPLPGGQPPDPRAAALEAAAGSRSGRRPRRSSSKSRASGSSWPSSASRNWPAERLIRFALEGCQRQGHPARTWPTGLVGADEEALEEGRRSPTCTVHETRHWPWRAAALQRWAEWQPRHHKDDPRGDPQESSQSSSLRANPHSAPRRVAR